jgi:beta-galactosidase
MKMKNSILTLLFILLIINTSIAQRREISLNGTWEIAKTDTLSGLPQTYTSKIPVPGLIDMANPSLPETGDRTDSAKRFDRGESHLFNNAVYWYKRKFKVEDTGKEIIQLKINKSMYHTRIYVNGKLAGENFYCFTPTYVNLKSFLKKAGQENELVISVGSRNNMPKNVVRSDDFEKDFFAPGIYDDVKLIISGLPYVTNIQIVPDILGGKVKVVAEIETSSDRVPFEIGYVIRESVSKRVMATGKVNGNSSEKAQGMVDFVADIRGFKLWSPETPFLYDLEIKTKGDTKTQRFGMRSFASAKEGGVVELNGKTYFMRGTNVCIFRFFEDAEIEAIFPGTSNG